MTDSRERRLPKTKTTMAQLPLHDDEVMKKSIEVCISTNGEEEEVVEMNTQSKNMESTSEEQLDCINNSKSFVNNDLPECTNCLSNKNIKENICNVNVSAASSEFGNVVTKFQEQVTLKEEAAGIESVNKTCSIKSITVDEVKGDKKTERALFKEEIKHFHCPFTWNLNFKIKIAGSESIIAHCSEKLEEIEEQGSFMWRGFFLTLLLCYEEYKCGNFPEAIAKLGESEGLFNAAESSDKPDKFFHSIKEALLHVLNACKCHLFEAVDLLSDAKKAKEEITRYEDMDEKNQAGILGIRAAVLLEYGYEGTKLAAEYAKQAVQVHENEGEWHFLLGKALGRLRRIENYSTIPTKEELSALETAVRIGKHAPYMVFLAQSYREAAFKTFSIKRNNLKGSLKQILNTMNERSVQLYREALEANGECVHINRRCAQGFMKLPPKFRDVETAEKCINKALQLAPWNAMANHVAGNLHERFLMNYDLAEEYYKKAGIYGAFGAYMDLMRMKFSRDMSYNPMPELQQLLQSFTEVPRAQESTMQMGAYYYYIKDDILTALDYWMKAIEMDPDSAKLNVFKCNLLNMKKPVNLYQVIVDEVQLTLNQKSLPTEDTAKLKKILLYCTEKHPDLLSTKPQSWRQNAWKEHNSYSNSCSHSQGGLNRGRDDYGHQRGTGGANNNQWHKGDNKQSQEGEHGSTSNSWSGQNKERNQHEEHGTQNYRQNRRGRDGYTPNNGSQSHEANRGYTSSSKEGGNAASPQERHDWRSEMREKGIRERGSSRPSSHDSSMGNSCEYRSNTCRRSHGSNVENQDNIYGGYPKYDGKKPTEDKNWRTGPRNFLLPDERSDLRRTLTDSMSSVESASGFISGYQGRQEELGHRQNWSQGCHGGSRGRPSNRAQK